jgi:hypothetical protein
MSLIPILDVIGKVVDRVVPDPNQRLQLQLELSKLADQESQRESNEAIAQVQANQQQATNPSIFVSGPRPALMWGGVVAIGWEAFLAPFLASCGVAVGHIQPEYFDTIMYLTFGLCGIRGFEKVKGVARDTLTEVTPTATPAAAPAKPKKKILGVEWPF